MSGLGDGLLSGVAAGYVYDMTFRYDDDGPIRVDIINSIIYDNSGGAYFSNNATVNISNTLFFGQQNGVNPRLRQQSTSPRRTAPRSSRPRGSAATSFRPTT